MEPGARNIAALLNGIGEDFNISDTEKRKLLQKQVYLAQQLGLPIVYSFSWYIHGPYSPSLTKDYYDLDASLRAGDEIMHYQLNEKYQPIAERLLELMRQKPKALAEKEDWAELLASIAFLRNQSGYSNDAARALINDRKPHVADYYDAASKALATVGLVRN